MDGEKFDLEQFPTSESAKRMLSYVTPGFYDNSYVGKGKGNLKRWSFIWKLR